MLSYFRHLAGFLRAADNVTAQYAADLALDAATALYWESRPIR